MTLQPESNQRPNRLCHSQAGMKRRAAGRVVHSSGVGGDETQSVGSALSEATLDG
jgi:hypothetical protein